MNNWVYLWQWVVMVAMLRMSYELSLPRQHSSPPEPTPSIPLHQEPSGLTSQQKEWAEKAVRRYADAQEKKWQHWRDTMFRPKS